MHGEINSGTDVGIATEFPPHDVACKIWAGSEYGLEVEFKKSCS